MRLRVFQPRSARPRNGIVTDDTKWAEVQTSRFRGCAYDGGTCSSVKRDVLILHTNEHVVSVT